MSPATLSDLLGWTSIACWLGAQFPQVLENARRRSCEGLALPFLANWLLGDITNLIGCILTHQLPFQTWLAAYFCSVDFMLFSQYFYYRAVSPQPTSSSLLEQTQRYSYTRQYSSEHTHYRALSSAAANVAVAAALAASEEEAQAQGRVHESSRPGSAVAQWQRHSMDEVRLQQGHSAPRLRGATFSGAGEEEADDDALAALADSFHSEGGRSRGRKSVSWSRERYPPAPRGGGSSRSRAATRSPTVSMRPALHLSVPPMQAEPLTYPEPHDDYDSALTPRGRPLQRQVADSPMGDSLLDYGADTDVEGALGGTRSRTTSVVRERHGSRASMRGAGLVFLGVWALFSVGTFAGSGLRVGVKRSVIGLGSMREPAGTVVGWGKYGRTLSTSDVHPISTPVTSILASTDGDSDADALSFSFLDIDTDLRPSRLDDTSPTYSTNGEPPPSSERILGRISAWTCTTLYLTSRLPQIWKNFVRKSVAGLSMALFVFAFLGNTFYVLSILTSPNLALPPPEAAAYIRESVPYLLGSGGTLLFDITIVVQSFLYRPNPKHHRHASSHPRKASHAQLQRPAQGQRPRSRSLAAEEEGLLSGDANARPLSASALLEREREGASGSRAARGGSAAKRFECGR